MGRPSASPENRAFAVCFAHAVTKKSHSRFDFVARSGQLSLFAALAKLFPAYARTEEGYGFRDGVSEVQLNKELQKNGFQRMRDRRTCATKKSNDPRGAGMYLFSSVQWRDPNLPEDREFLLSKYNEMKETFPLIMLSCKLNKFLEVLTTFHAEWAASCEKIASEAEIDLEDSDCHSEAANRSTSVSPGAVHQTAGAPAASNNPAFPFCSLASLSTPPPKPFLTASTRNNNSLYFSLSKPLFKSFGAFDAPSTDTVPPSLHQQQSNLRALQTQLTSSLLAIALAQNSSSRHNTAAAAAAATTTTTTNTATFNHNQQQQSQLQQPFLPSLEASAMDFGVPRSPFAPFSTAPKDAFGGSSTLSGFDLLQGNGVGITALNNATRPNLSFGALNTSPTLNMSPS